MKQIFSLLAIILFGLVAFNTMPHIKTTKFNESSRMKSVVMAEPINVPAQKETPAVEPVRASIPVEGESPKKAHTGNCDLAYDYDWPQKTAWAICMAESSGNPASVGDTNTEYVSCGLMQIRSLPGRPSCEQLKDGAFNMQYAYNMWRGQGFKPWSAYTQGWYIKYL